jgi:1-aminocyclopropane-1-carboxylate deaminase/D-cysteine desulfhydrase-like pyridoxal-dependent ACC family enzyme
MEIFKQAIPLQQLIDEHTTKHGINLYMLRTDLNNKHISGNKLYKLKHNLIEAKKLNLNTILTYGGAYSNHIAATAAAGKAHNFKTIGIIRGEEYPELNPTLKFAKGCGMEIHYYSRSTFRDKALLKEKTNKEFGNLNPYIIPMGGSNELGIKGCTEIIDAIKVDFDIITAGCGTGATLAGIISSINDNQTAIGFPALKAPGYIKEEIEKNWISNKSNWHINDDYHFGGLAKTKPELLSFMEKFEVKYGIPLDKVYTGKMMFGIYNLIEKSHFKKGTTIVAVHTGGLQGNANYYD